MALGGQKSLIPIFMVITIFIVIVIVIAVVIVIVIVIVIVQMQRTALLIDNIHLIQAILPSHSL